MRHESGDERRVEPRVMDLLVALARRPGKVVGREILIAEIWGETHVASDGLFRHVSELRRLLGDHARAPRYVQTIPKRGYRLVAMPVALFEAPDATPPARRVSLRRLLLLAAMVLGVLLTGDGASSLGRRERAGIVSAASRGTAAFDAFARARVHDERVDCASYRRAIDTYRSALNGSPPFAGAINGYADALLASAMFGCQSTPSAMSALDDLLAQTAGRRSRRDTLAFSPADRLRVAAGRALFGLHDVALGGDLLARARAREPDLQSDVLFAVHRAAVGDTPDAVEAARRAVAADPGALGENWSLALALYFDRRYKDAVAQLRRTLEMYPESEAAGNLMLLVLAQLDLDGAVAVASRGTAAEVRDLDRFAFAPAYVKALAGHTDSARRLLDAWRRAAVTRWVPATAPAALAFVLGDADEAARWLARAEVEGDAWLLFRRLDPTLATPAFKAPRAAIPVSASAAKEAGS
jgi:tetratricopeptide (TPR) repeat protein